MKKTILWPTLAFVLFSNLCFAQTPDTVPAAKDKITFTLIDQKGAAVNESILNNKPSIMVFGYSNCPDICRAEMADVSRWLKALGPDADKLNAFFVTIDPDTDTPERLSKFLKKFDPHFTGLTGTAEQMAAFLKIYEPHGKSEVMKPNDSMTVHSVKVFLIEKGGKYSDFILYQEKDDTAATRLKRFIIEKS